MKLLVYSLEKILYSGNAKSVNCKTRAGEITVLDNHEPLISALSEGVMKIQDQDQKEHFVQVKSGFLEVKYDNEVRCIIEQ